MAEALKRWNGSTWELVATVNRVELSAGIANPLIIRIYNVDLSTTESYVEFDKTLTMDNIQDSLDAFVYTYNLNGVSAGYFEILAIEVIDSYTVKINHTDLGVIDDSRLTVGYNDERGTLFGTNGYEPFGMFKTNTMTYPFIGIRFTELAPIITTLNNTSMQTISDQINVTNQTPVGKDLSESVPILFFSNLSFAVIDDGTVTTILE